MTELMTTPLPDGFLWGFAHASYQVEGSTAKGGRGSSIWDDFSKTPGKVVDGATGDVATDSYVRFKEDIALLKSYGRFSLSWSRIIPLGGSDDPVNPSGIQFYSDYIDELIGSGIEPFVTLYHWDLPSTLQQRYNGWLDKDQITRDFVRYARVCFEAFGSRVKYWLTLNEPFCSAILGHSIGCHAPGRTSDRTKSTDGDSSTEPWIVGHNLLVAHAHVVDLYHREYKHGQIGITLNGDWCEPLASSPEDVAAAERALEFWVGWFADAVYLTGGYPASMRVQLGDRLPTFTEEEKKLVLGSSDFYGMNHYSSNHIKHKDATAALDDFQGNVEYINVPPLGVKSDLGWLQDVPSGFHKLLVWIWKRYKTPIFVTENGFCCRGESLFAPEEAIHDHDRVSYFSGYLAAMQQAMLEDGVDVRCYLGWSMLDNFEWAEGYGPRFGVTYVNYETQERTPKDSARFVQQWFSTRLAK